MFEDLGIIDRVIAHGRMAMPMHSTAPDGQVTLGGAAPEALRDRPDIPYTASLITPEWRVEEALRLRLAEFGGAVEFGTALGSFEQSDEGVSAVVVKGGEAETVTARWLVGCDGGHSIVRKQAGIAFVGETREEVRMIVADVEVDGLDRDVWHMWQHEEGLVSLCPLPSTDRLPVPGPHRAGTGPRAQPREHAGDPRAAHRPYRHPPPRDRSGRRCGAPTSASSTATARVACSWPATRRTSTRPPAARG